LRSAGSAIWTASWGLVFLRGLFTFYAIYGLGRITSLGIAGDVFARNEVWWLAGLADVAVGSVWNYAVSSVFHVEAKMMSKIT
jgi:hypothetical protein